MYIHNIHQTLKIDKLNTLFKLSMGKGRNRGKNVC